MRIIDAHIHYNPKLTFFSDMAASIGHDATEERLRETFSSLGIEHAVIMGNGGLDLNDHRYPDFTSYCIGLDGFEFDLSATAKSLDLIEAHLKRSDCSGIKIYAGYNQVFVYEPEFFPVYELAAQYKKPVAIHTGEMSGGHGRLKSSHPLTLDEIAPKFRNTQFVMCHFGNPWLVDAAAVMQNNENVAADLSGFLEGIPDIDEYIERTVGYFDMIRSWLAYMGDYGRLMYGTDWPLVNMERYIEFVSRLIPERHHKEVFFDNANRIYRLGL